jgi:hypothetical protein
VFRSRTLLLLFTFVAASAVKGQEAGYAGASACAGCHLKQYEAQSRSAHAGALSPAAAHPLAQQITAAVEARDGAWNYRFVLSDPQSLEVEVRSGGAVRREPVTWAFGSGYQAVTFVSQLNENEYLEHHLSYYSRDGQLGLTPGHYNQPIDTAEQALGVHYPTFSPGSEILRCFRCHSTGPLELTDQFAVQPTELGVRCESCHGPGANHIAKIAAGDRPAARQAIGNPARLDANALMQFCGRCHRPPSADAVDWRDPWNVRHQPIYLTQSACFRESAAGLTCMNCHDPHEPIRRNEPAYYDARCAQCHSAEQRPIAAACRTDVGCASCHMPSVSPQASPTFHNHWIGIYGSDPLRPLGSSPASALRISPTSGSAAP